MGHLQNEDSIVGYLKYEGISVQEGIMNAADIVSSLDGFSQAIQFYVKKTNSQYENIKLDIPVKVQQGCIEYIVPILKWSIVAYAAGAIAQIAQNDFKDVNSKDIFLFPIKCISYIIKIAKHLGRIEKNPKIHFSIQDPFVTIYNDDGHKIIVPKDIFKLYLETPSYLLAKMANIVNSERILEVGYIDEKTTIHKETITCKEKHIFSDENEEGDILPELVHGANVEIEGEITKGNSSTNRLGIKYKEKILTCIPAQTSIKHYKDCIFRKCKIYGIIDRKDEFGNITEKKPKIIFFKLIPLEDSSIQPTLFS